MAGSKIARDAFDEPRNQKQDFAAVFVERRWIALNVLIQSGDLFVSGDLIEMANSFLRTSIRASCAWIVRVQSGCEATRIG